MELRFDEVFANLQANKAWRDYPQRGANTRCADGLLWPKCRPTFRIDPSAAPTIFTIGSCFARNIENSLERLGFALPTRLFRTPDDERNGRGPQGMLNEFNPGSIQQRILYALEGRTFDEQTLVPAGGNLFADLLLVRGCDVEWQRSLERRGQVAFVYRQLASSQYVLITLGLSEAWYDLEASIYLNRMPPYAHMKAHPKRYSLRRLDSEECSTLLEPAIAALVDRGIKVLLTISPVPLTTTMSLADAIVANEGSKAALRACAERICRRLRGVDYFPSYEIVRSGGLASYDDDNIHVKDELVRKVTAYMVESYCSPEGQAPAPHSEPATPVVGYFDGH